MPDVAAQYLEHWQDRWNKVQTGDPDKHFSPGFLSPQPPRLPAVVFFRLFSGEALMPSYPATAPGLPCLQMK